MKITLVLLLCLVISGCFLATKMNLLSVGMSKQEVLKTVGYPHSSKADNNTEILEYRFRPDMWSSYPDTYWVVLQDGKVIKYGRAGDFGTTMPEDRREYNINVNQ